MKITSGGQTGVDRAALDAAKSHGLEIGGWCPKNRKAEDGAITSTYPLQETPSTEYTQRTEWNVRDADASLILVRKLPLTGGTAITVDFAKRHRKPYLIVNMSEPYSLEKAISWLKDLNPSILNIAGPRESYEPGIYTQALAFLKQML